MISISDVHQVSNFQENTDAFYKSKTLKGEDKFFKQIEFYAYDMEWLIRDKAGIEFIQYLARQDKSARIFESKFIQTLIDY